MKDQVMHHELTWKIERENIYVYSKLILIRHIIVNYKYINVIVCECCVLQHSVDCSCKNEVISVDCNRQISKLMYYKAECEFCILFLYVLDPAQKLVSDSSQSFYFSIVRMQRIVRFVCKSSIFWRDKWIRWAATRAQNIFLIKKIMRRVTFNFVFGFCVRRMPNVKLNPIHLKQFIRSRGWCSGQHTFFFLSPILINHNYYLHRWILKCVHFSGMQSIPSSHGYFEIFQLCMKRWGENWKMPFLWKINTHWMKKNGQKMLTFAKKKTEAFKRDAFLMRNPYHDYYSDDMVMIN